MTTGKSAIWTISYGCCWVSPNGVLDGIGQKNPPTTIPSFSGVVCLVISPDSLIPM